MRRSRSSSSSSSSSSSGSSSGWPKPLQPPASMMTIGPRARGRSVTGAAEHSDARSVGSDARTRSGASARRASATEHGYKTPWLEFDSERLRQVVRKLDYIARPPLSLEEFREGILGADEHAFIRGSKSHLLSTMARSITAFIRTRLETNCNLDELLLGIIGCARRIVNKRPPWRHESSRASDDRITTLCTLYEFMNNRCNDAAIQVMIDRALNLSDSLWAEMSLLERDMALDLLRHYDVEVQQECRRMKDDLGSS